MKMKNTFRALLALIIVFSSFYACVKDENETPVNITYGYDYFPLKVGKYREYQLDSIIFDTIAGRTLVDSSRTYIRESVTDTFVNTAGKTVYRVERFEKKKLTDIWVVKDIVTAERNTTQAIRSEKNFRMLKITFPVRLRSPWSSTVFFDPTVEVKAGKKEIEIFKNWESEIKSIATANTILGKKYDNVLTIIHADDENKIELRRVTEQYANGIGLIANEMEILDTQAANSNASWRKKAQKGFILKQYLIDYN